MQGLEWAPPPPHGSLPPTRSQSVLAARARWPDRGPKGLEFEGLRSRVRSLGFRGLDPEFRVHGYRVQGYRVQGSGFRACSLGFRVWGSGFALRVKG